ncbi:MAG: sulfite exporter TauE/SafE family protein [candidate division Zixibacteria bacterium]|nr:sulfite exporter TauE/SafE family protein [candidate division Zixibacteria bacterium]
METWLVAAGTALWLGFLTSISPCPLATNIAAISYIGKEVKQPRAALWRGMCYTLGRVVAYVGLSAILVSAVLAVPDVALFLQNDLNKVLGPLLVVVGLVLLNVIRLPVFSSGTLTARMQGKFTRVGLFGALLLGVVFGLSFCPISAALFFGSLIPLSLEQSSPVMLPLLYGLGTAFPVVLFAIVLVFAAHLVGRMFNAVSLIERWARPATGIIFVVVGLYFCKEYVIGW